MINKPIVSVVISAYNGLHDVETTVLSILEQTYENLEVIVVDDGSLEPTRALLQKLRQKDSRINLLVQSNHGLTVALINGCSSANGRYIARQDVGDWSHPDRIRRQVEYLESNRSVAAVSCNVEFLSPEGKQLFQSSINSNELSQALRSENVKELMAPPHHGAVMFRRDAYNEVGGYRTEFHFAQDLDLWCRLIKIGSHNVIDWVGYSATLNTNTISGLYRNEQNQLKSIIANLNNSDLSAESVTGYLNEASAIKPTAKKNTSLKKISESSYFIAGCLKTVDTKLAKQYYLQSIKYNRWNMKAWLQLIRIKLL